MFDDVNEKLDTWEWIFNDVMNRHVPIVKKRVKHKPLLPWMNNDILQLMHRRDQFKARAKSNILAGIMYKSLRNQAVKTIAKAKTDYVRNEISKNMNNPRKLWKTLKRIAPTKSAPSNFSFIETEDKSFYDPSTCDTWLQCGYLCRWHYIMVANSNPLHIQHGLQGSLNKANHWFSLNKMVPNAKKQNSYLMEPSKNFPTAQTHRLTFHCEAPKSKRPSTKSCLVSR